MLYFYNYVVCDINSDDVYKLSTFFFLKIENIDKPPFTNRTRPTLNADKPSATLDP